MRPGLRVALHGLAREEFNHHCGTVEERKGASGDRVAVRVDSGVLGGDSAKRILVAPERLRVLPRYRETGFAGASLVVVERLIKPLLPCWPHVEPFLRVPRVEHKDVEVSGASSSRGDFPLSCALLPNEQWWISDSPCEEWLELDLKGWRCVAAVGLRIPPLPMGPLSVRSFRVEALGPRGWRTVLEAQTRDAAELQEFALGVEADRLRLVCTSTAAEAMPCVGLYEVRLG